LALALRITYRLSGGFIRTAPNNERRSSQPLLQRSRGSSTCVVERGGSRNAGLRIAQSGYRVSPKNSARVFREQLLAHAIEARFLIVG
jgi:hypothetical protein